MPSSSRGCIYCINSASVLGFRSSTYSHLFLECALNYKHQIHAEAGNYMGLHLARCPDAGWSLSRRGLAASIGRCSLVQRNGDGQMHSCAALDPPETASL